MKLIALFLIVMTFCILTNSSLSLTYATLGLELWFQKMIPALLPFMILSGILVRLGLTEKMSMVLYPVLGPVYRVRKNVIYCIMLGFLCGFPMGAKVTADLLERDLLTRDEGEYLLAFCNNIGPVYFCSFVLPLLGRRLVLPYLFGMYGIPLLYGLLLRYTFFRNRLYTEKEIRRISRKPELLCCERTGSKTVLRFLSAADESIRASLASILTLGGYMILFNLFNLLPHLLLRREPLLAAPLLEISGGLSLLGGRLPLYSLLVLSFGGLSCVAQTYSCIRNTGLSVGSYLKHKVILTLLTAAFYLCWFLAAPSTFLL
ncbi:MAG: hypothetical protein NC432_05840 [Roseburia sp.]|nr:hypothetical protein [Roseburia sp.]MCM1098826.1 hypothetical protein [Ruminococcus flavefaciens]